jgi:type III restriction enzyme
VHPTVLTDDDGKPLAEIESANLGRMTEALTIADNYLFDELHQIRLLNKRIFVQKFMKFLYL